MHIGDIFSLIKKLFSRTHDEHMPKQVPQGREYSVERKVKIKR